MADTALATAISHEIALIQYSRKLGKDTTVYIDNIMKAIKEELLSTDKITTKKQKDELIKFINELFDSELGEWSEELEKYQNASLKRDSAAKLRDTQRRYASLMKAMRKAESKMSPVLSALQDNVLYLKHNLNASAIGALQGELSTIESNVSQLIQQMNSAIAESDAFIASMKN